MAKKLLSIWLLLGIVFFGTWGIMAASQTTELNISAAASLKDVLLDMQKSYQQKNPNIKLILNFGSSGALQAQIEQGAPADLFISAAAKQMDDLEKKGLLQKGTRRNVLENRLVMVVSRDSALRLNDFKDLAQDNVKKIGIGAPASVPAGQYAQQVFQFLKIWDKLQGKLVLGTDVRAVLTYVETGNVDAGIVYRTDALISNKVKIAATAPDDSHDLIVYPAAVLANAANSREAGRFLAYLVSADGKELLEKYGFIVGK